MNEENGINEKYFHQATDEYDSNELDDSIMSKALSLSGGDEEKAKWKYIELRAERISEDSNVNVKKEEEKKKEEEEKKGTSGWKIFFIILFFPITIPYYLIKNGFFIFWWSGDD